MSRRARVRDARRQRQMRRAGDLHARGAAGKTRGGAARCRLRARHLRDPLAGLQRQGARCRAARRHAAEARRHHQGRAAVHRLHVRSKRIQRPPDHVAISRFTSDAIAAAADARWYPELGEAHATPALFWSTLLEPWQETAPNARDEPGVDLLLDVSAWADKKEAALRAHRTQHKSVEHHFFSKPNLKAVLSVESWRRAWPHERADLPF